MDDRCNRYEKQIQNAATVLIASAIVELAPESWTGLILGG